MRCKACNSIIPEEKLFKDVDGKQVLEDVCPGCVRQTAYDIDAMPDKEYFHDELTKKSDILY